jgi:hypothetical protein
MRQAGELMNSASSEQGATNTNRSAAEVTHDVPQENPRDSESAHVMVNGSTSSADTIVADPNALDRAGLAISELDSIAGLVPLDPELLQDDVVGHAGLAQALREFVDLWEQRLSELGKHTTAIGLDLRQAGRSYQDTDDAAAHELADLDPSSHHGRQG